MDPTSTLECCASGTRIRVFECFQAALLCLIQPHMAVPMRRTTPTTVSQKRPSKTAPSTASTNQMMSKITINPVTEQLPIASDEEQYPGPPIGKRTETSDNVTLSDNPLPQTRAAELSDARHSYGRSWRRCEPTKTTSQLFGRRARDQLIDLNLGILFVVGWSVR